jgi:hypothetical protein
MTEAKSSEPSDEGKGGPIEWRDASQDPPNGRWRLVAERLDANGASWPGFHNPVLKAAKPADLLAALAANPEAMAACADGLSRHTGELREKLTEAQAELERYRKFACDVQERIDIDAPKLERLASIREALADFRLGAATQPSPPAAVEAKPWPQVDERVRLMSAESEMTRSALRDSAGLGVDIGQELTVESIDDDCCSVSDGEHTWMVAVRDLTPVEAKPAEPGIPDCPHGVGLCTSSCPRAMCLANPPGPRHGEKGWAPPATVSPDNQLPCSMCGAPDHTAHGHFPPGFSRRVSNQLRLSCALPDEEFPAQEQPASPNRSEPNNGYCAYGACVDMPWRNGLCKDHWRAPPAGEQAASPKLGGPVVIDGWECVVTDDGVREASSVEGDDYVEGWPDRLCSFRPTTTRQHVRIPRAVAVWLLGLQEERGGNERG